MNRKVMIIEDEAIIAFELSELLVKNGFEVVAIARTVEEAVGMFRTHRAHLIISDVRLDSGTEGFIALNLINKEAGCILPVVFVTGFGWISDEAVEKLFPHGALLHKPIEERALMETIDQVLRESTGPPVTNYRRNEKSEHPGSNSRF